MSETGGRWLVVGSDGFVGSRLLEILSAEQSVIGTTRNPGRVGGRKVLLDLENCPESRIDALGDIAVCVFCAMRTNYDACAGDEAARIANTVRIPEVVKGFLARGMRVVFLSSNAVFGGERPFCNESDELTPLFPYAEHKAEAEEAITRFARELDAEDRLSILRLTKVLDHSVPPLPEWTECLRTGEDIRAFTDFIFSPVTPAHVSEVIGKIVSSGESGIFHLSGEANLSYFEFAGMLAEKWGDDDGHRVRPATSVEGGLDLAFLPTFSAIGMERTTGALGVRPVRAADVADAIIAEARTQD